MGVSLVIKRIHVNQHNLRHNKHQGEKRPPITVKTSKANITGYRAVVNGPSEVVYRPEKPLSCGAVMWVETTAEVIVLGENNESTSIK